MFYRTLNLRSLFKSANATSVTWTWYPKSREIVYVWGYDILERYNLIYLVIYYGPVFSGIDGLVDQYMMCIDE